ncbi:MAG: class I SAM-dependent methyltransferase [Thermanaerothrix sp.]|nr:class I SAM-dependent methyltransferase [Thermanaerothrix sp.]
MGSFQFNFQHYLTVKRSVDDRALNRHVWDSLVDYIARTPHRPLKLLEVGAGIGTMIQRVWEWGLVENAIYTALDLDLASLRYAQRALENWAQRNQIPFEKQAGCLHFQQGRRSLRVDFLTADAFAPGQSPLRSGIFDGVIVHAVMDLVNLEEGLSMLASYVRPGGWLYLTLNFDGLTQFLPPLNPNLDAQIITLYHQSMDERRFHGLPTGGSATGRALLILGPALGLDLVAVGASDWVVSPRRGEYQSEEADFLRSILHFVEDSLSRQALISPSALADWLATRREQVSRCELVFIAHQLDFLFCVSK